MAITLDPTKPPDTGESPTLGAQRIRNVSTFLLQLLGFTGTVSETLNIIPFTVSASTGIVTLAGNGTSGTEPVVFQQFTTGSANGGTWFKLPGGLIVQFKYNFSASTTGSVLLPTSFTSSTSFGCVGVFTGAGSTNLQITNISSSTVEPVFGGTSPQTLTIIAVGS